MNPPTENEIAQIIEDFGYVDNDDARNELKGMGLLFDNGKGIIEQVVYVNYDADEAAAMLDPVAKYQTPEAIHSASVRAVGIWEILAALVPNTFHFDELLSKLERELENGPADALTFVSLCLFGRDAARRHRELAAAVSGMIGSQNRHNRKNGSRDKKCQLIEVWKSGKYETKTLCAEQEYEYFEVSFDTARKWL